MTYLHNDDARLKFIPKPNLMVTLNLSGKSLLRISINLTTILDKTIRNQHILTTTYLTITYLHMYNYMTIIFPKVLIDELYTFELYTHLRIEEGSGGTTSIVPFKEFSTQSADESPKPN